MEGKVIVCAMDARRSQVYNAIFLAKDGKLERLSEDRAISLADLAQELKNIENEKIVVGDGAKLCYNVVSEMGIALTLAPEHLRMQSGWGVARAAQELAEKGQLIKGEKLNAVYHRLSQAERERMEKQKNT
jgi:tRNA threonylcarbamoyladenosine biosynthesis protein TsaB